MVSQSLLDVHGLDAFSFVPPNGYWLRQKFNYHSHKFQKQSSKSVDSDSKSRVSSWSALHHPREASAWFRVFPAELADEREETLVSRLDSGLLSGLCILIGKTLSHYYCAVVFPTMQNRKATLRGYNQPHPSVFEQPQKWQGSEHLKNRIQALWPSFCLSNWHTEGAQYLLAGCLEKWFAQSSFC